MNLHAFSVALIGLFALALIACSGGDLSDEEEFARRLERFEGTTYKLTYELTREGTDIDDIPASLVWYQHDDRIRVDEFQTEGPTTWIFTEQRSYLCDHLTVISGGCKISPASEIQPLSYRVLEIVEPDDFIITSSLERTVADLEADCFSFEPLASEEPGRERELCLSSEGVLVFARISFAEPTRSTTYTLTEIESNVTEGIFEPDRSYEGPACQAEGAQC